VNALVTGGAGFIGSHVVDALLEGGHRVTVLDNFSTGRKENLAAGCVPVEGDVRDADAVSRCVRGQDVVFHLAAFVSLPESIERPEACLDTNVAGTRTLLEACVCAGVRRVVFASSSAVYADDSAEPLDESVPPAPASPYAASKLEGEHLLEWFRERHDLGYAALRYFNVYGPRQDVGSDYAAVVPRFLGQALEGEPLTIFGDGRQTRDFVYVADVARANLAGLAAGASGVFNIGTGRAVSVRELADEVLRLTGSRSERRFAPPRAGDAFCSTADARRAAAVLGWSPGWRLDRGLAATIDWFRACQG
jgi:UDP-glucose 4-epimerase